MGGERLKHSEMIAAHKAVVHLEFVHDHLQALHALSVPEPVKRSVIMAQKVAASISDDVKKWAKIKDEEPEIFLPAFPGSTHKHLKPRTSWRHLAR